MSLYDKDLEVNIFAKLLNLEEMIDSVGPTIVRHRLSELIVEMRQTLWNFDQAKYEQEQI